MPSTEKKRKTKMEERREGAYLLLKKLFKGTITLSDKDHDRLVNIDDCTLPMVDVGEIEEPIDLTDFDYDIPVRETSSLLAKKETATELDTPGPGTKQVCIRIPNHLIAAYRHKAASSGSKYQTLMIRDLLEASDGWKK